MKRLAVIVGVLLILIIGGGLTAQLTTNRDATTFLPVLRTVDNPDGSTLAISPWQGEQLFLLVGFVLVNVIGIGATIAIVIWLLHRFVAQAKVDEKPPTVAVEKKPVASARAAQKS